jgi:hypothetical protein
MLASIGEARPNLRKRKNLSRGGCERTDRHNDGQEEDHGGERDGGILSLESVPKDDDKWHRAGQSLRDGGDAEAIHGSHH